VNVTRWLVALGSVACTASDAGAQRLFKSDAPLEITITTGLKTLIKQRDSTELVKHGAVATYQDSTGQTVSIPVTLRARGHFRRQARNCEFPPLYFEPKNSAAKGTIFANAGKMKLTTNCRPGDADYEQYILQEFLLYRAYAMFTDSSFRTRLVHVTYRDSANAVRPLTSWAFFIEDPEMLAARMGGEPFKKTGAYFADVEQDPLGLVGMYQFFVGNTDWSIHALHNTTLVADSLMRIVTVPYDFDWSGVINTRYATPDARFKVRSVTTRIYRGDCRDEKALRPIIDRFLAKRAAINTLLGSLPQLTPARVKTMREYLDEFWALAEKPAALARKVADTCQQKGN